MSKINNGGPAFPLPDLSGYGIGPFEKDGSYQMSGMSLRDWFAGQALMGFLANTKRPTTYAADDAAWAYTIADAMILAREADPS